MATIQDQIARARAAGYSDDDIATHLSATVDFATKLKLAQAAGYKTSDIVSHLAGAPAAPPAAAAPAPQGMLAGAWDGAKNLGLGLARGAMDPIDGGAQLLVNGAASATHWLRPGSTADKFMRAQAEGVNATNTDREKKYQAMTPGSIAAGVGRVGGNIAIPLKGVSAANDAGLLARTAGAVSTGAVVGAVQPVYGAREKTLSDLVTGDQPADYWSEKAKQVGIGAVTGGALAGAGKVIGSTYNTIRPIVSPSSAAGNQILNNLSTASAAERANGAPLNYLGLTASDPQAVLARLQAAKQIVPGSFPTTAQVAGSPELVMAEKVLRNTPAYTPRIMAREASNNAARNQAVANVAQTPEALAAAVRTRGDASRPLYDAFDQQTLPIDDTLRGLLGTPIGQDAIARARVIAQNQQRPFGLTAGTEAGSTPSALLGADGMPLYQTVVDAVPGSITGNAANMVKMAIDSMRRAPPTAGIASHEAGALADVRNALVNHLDSTAPTFRAAREAYAAGSVPVNTMTLGQDLQNALSGGAQNYAGETAPTLTKYAGRLNAAEGRQDFPVDPDALAALRAVHQDLQRRSVSDSVPKSGSDTIWNAQAPNWLSGQLMGQNLDGNSLLGRGAGALGGFLTGGPVGAAGGLALMQKGSQFLGNRVNTQLQDAMMNPDVFARLLQQALDRQSGSAIVNNLAPVGNRAATVGASNVLSTGP